MKRSAKINQGVEGTANKKLCGVTTVTMYAMTTSLSRSRKSGTAIQVEGRLTSKLGEGVAQTDVTFEFHDPMQGPIA
jgi:hypothetical protein